MYRAWLGCRPHALHYGSHQQVYKAAERATRGHRIDWEKWSWSLSLRLVYPVLHKPPGATITSRSAFRIRINFWRMVGLYISFGDWANALECWRSPSLRLVIPGIAVSPGVTHSDSRIVFVTGTVVKPQQPTYSWSFWPLSHREQLAKRSSEVPEFQKFLSSISSDGTSDRLGISSTKSESF